MPYIARQPIFDVERKLQAYELLFRESTENRFTSDDPDMASKQAIDTAVLVGLDVLSEGCRLFLNCTHDFIVQGFPALFPPDLTVVEVLGTVEPDEAVLRALRDLKWAGYRIALDDYSDEPRFAPLVDLADIIKVDFRSTPSAERASLVDRYAIDTRQLLAEKVETPEEFAEGVALGFELFQGYLLGEPEILMTSKMPILPHTPSRIHRALASARLDLIEVEQLIKSEPALCYRLLRYLKSPAYYLQTEIKSILQALALLGEAELRQWLLLMAAVVSFGGEQDPERIAAALVRARFAELLSSRVGGGATANFLTSLFATMEAMIDRPLPLILHEVVLPDEVMAALSGEANRLRQGQELVAAFTSGDWAAASRRRIQLQIPETELRSAYREAVAWASGLTNTPVPGERRRLPLLQPASVKFSPAGSYPSAQGASLHLPPRLP